MLSSLVQLYGVGRGTDETHHICAEGSKQAVKTRKLLDKWGIGINHPANGVYLPATTKSPNPAGAAVHSTLHTNDYYRKVDQALLNARNRREAIKILGDIREALLKGNF